MIRRVRSIALVLALVCLGASAAEGGGAWVPQRGDGDITFGYSRKRADFSWDTNGKTVPNNSIHDFRYGYLNGEMGLDHRLSMTYSVLYLNGFEGATENLENNRGLSELFLGMKNGLPVKGNWPMAVAFNVRTSVLYDQYGTYDRHLFLPDDDDLDGDGDTEEAIPNKVDSEWRGLLGEDYGLKFLASRNLFPDASRAVLTGAFFSNIGQAQIWYLEAGYNHWVWGLSTWKYDEPYLTLGRRF